MDDARRGQADHKRSWERALEQRRWILIGAIVAAALAWAGIGWWWPTWGPLAFDRAEWDAAEYESKDNDFRRHRMADDLIRSKTLYGKTGAEVMAQLGAPPEHFIDDDGLTYMLGYSRGWFALWADLLYVELNDEGRVSEVWIFQD